MFNPHSGGSAKYSDFLTSALEALGPRAVKHQSDGHTRHE